VFTYEGWREVKVASFSQIENKKKESAQPEVKLKAHSYRAGIWSAEEFQKHQWAEAVSRGIDQAQRLVSVNDGAPWIWNIVWWCYPQAIEILDWAHGVGYLQRVAHAVYGEGTPEEADWMEGVKGKLWCGEVEAVQAKVAELEGVNSQSDEVIRRAQAYLKEHQERMRYNIFRESGYPIGSGVVESACKTVVEQRLKQAGMRWSIEGAQAILALRSSLLSDRWDEMWAFFHMPYFSS
jgi:hypothetical protein